MVSDQTRLQGCQQIQGEAWAAGTQSDRPGRGEAMNLGGGDTTGTWGGAAPTPQAGPARAAESPAAGAGRAEVTSRRQGTPGKSQRREPTGRCGQREPMRSGRGLCTLHTGCFHSVSETDSPAEAEAVGKAATRELTEGQRHLRAQLSPAWGRQGRWRGRQLVTHEDPGTSLCKRRL